MKSEINNRKIAAILIAMIIAISAFPMTMTATADEPDANFTEAANIACEEENAAENITPGNQTNSVANITDNTAVAAVKSELPAVMVTATAKIWYVDDDGGPGINFTKIQDAIDNASGGDIIFVFNGTYKENLNINKHNLTIIGEDKTNTTIDGFGKTCVCTSGKQNSISGFTMQNGEYGIHISETGFHKINNNIIKLNSKDGILLHHSSKNEIRDNVVENNKGNGIYFEWSSNNKVIRNEIRYNDGSGVYLYVRSFDDICNDNEIRDNIIKYNKGNGIDLRPYYHGYKGNCNGNKLINNTLSYNSGDGIKFSSKYESYDVAKSNEITKNEITFNGGHGIYMGKGANENSLKQNEISDNGGTGLFIENPRNYISQDNEVNGKTIYHFYKVYGTEANPVIVENKDLTDPYIINWAKVSVIDSYYVIIRNCTLSNSDRGVYIDGSRFVQVVNNNVKDNPAGIELYNSEFSKINDNNVTLNDGHGIFLSESPDNEIINNSISRNKKDGIHLTGDNSQDNKLEKNKMDGNGGTGLVLSNPRSYISQDNVVNGEHIYHFYKVAGTEDNPIIVENLSLTKPAVINYAKISVIDSYHIIIRNCTVSYSERGIYIGSSKALKVENNSANYNTYGIDVGDSSPFVEVIGNDVCYNTYGIYMYGSSNKIIENKANFNSKDGMLLHDSSNNEISDNLVENNKGNGIYLEGGSNNKVIENVVENNKGNGIYFEWSSNNKVIRNEIRYNDGSGVYLYAYSSYGDCNDNEIRDNTIRYNKGYGIRLYARYDPHCDNNKLVNNTISYNTKTGISFYVDGGGEVDGNEVTNNKIRFNGVNGIYIGSRSNENKIKQNEISDNGDYGIYIDMASNNLIYNNYINNTKNAYDCGTNCWNITKTAGTSLIGGSYLGGNYWSDYTGIDADGDWLGDTPYDIPGGTNKDYLPLVGFVPQKPTVSITTDKTIYSPGDTMTITIDITNPTEESITFQWHWGVPQFSVWVPVMSSSIPAGYDDTLDFRFTIPDWGSTPFGNVFYVQLLDASGEVLDADVTWWAYSPSGKAMPAAEMDITKEIKETIEKIE